MKCEHCGYEAPERAVICPECGEILPRPVSEPEQAQSAEIPDNFSMPFLHAPVEETGTHGGTVDPNQLVAQKEIKRNVRRRLTITAVVAGILAILLVLYAVFFSGYKLAAYRYIKGADYESGSMYIALVPDAFMDYLESTYETTRRDIKETVSSYWAYWNENYGNEGSMSYDITSHYSLSESSLEELEEEIMEDYGIRVSITKAVKVNFSVDDGGNKQSEQGTFVKIGMKWCCIEAMDTIDYACYYAGSGGW